MAFISAMGLLYIANKEDKNENRQIEKNRVLFTVGERLEFTEDGNAGCFVVRKGQKCTVTEINEEDFLVSLDGFPLEMKIHLSNLDFITKEK